MTCKQLREADIVLIVSDLLGCEGRAVSWSKAADRAAAQTSREADKEATRAQDRLAGMGGAERVQLTSALDARKDRYLQLLTEQAGVEPLPPFLHRRNKNREAGGGDTETIIYGVWISNSSRDPFGKTKGRQEDREAAAAFSHSYARVALPALRARKFADGDTGVPIEWFTWRRVIIDECHEPLCMGADDADESAMSSKRSSCAVRELLGIALPDVAARPLLAQRGTFGLTGTPLLSSVARITCNQGCNPRHPGCNSVHPGYHPNMYMCTRWRASPSSRRSVPAPVRTRESNPSPTTPRHNMPHATCHTPHATCHMPHATSPPR